MDRVSDRPVRWSQATIYPDMWVDPNDDTRNSEGVSADGEQTTLRDYLTNYRITLRMKCEGLTPEQLALRSVPPSTMSLLGLLRHLAEAERDWRSWISSEIRYRSCTAKVTRTSTEPSPSRPKSTLRISRWRASRPQPTPRFPSIRI